MTLPVSKGDMLFRNDMAVFHAREGFDESCVNMKRHLMKMYLRDADQRLDRAAIAAGRLQRKICSKKSDCLNEEIWYTQVSLAADMPLTVRQSQVVPLVLWDPIFPAYHGCLDYHESHSNVFLETVDMLCLKTLGVGYIFALAKRHGVSKRSCQHSVNSRRTLYASVDRCTRAAHEVLEHVRIWRLSGTAATPCTRFSSLPSIAH